MKVKVYAKLNLSLNVFSKQGNFHPIDSVVTSINLFDQVDVVARKDKKVVIKGFMPTKENIAYKTAVAFVSQFDTNGVTIAIKKGIPVGSGMGGSSADAAGVIYCMCNLFNVDIGCQKVSDLCATLGSDISFMLHGGLARMQGKGDDVTFGQCPDILHFAITCFAVGMSAAEVYQEFDNLPTQPHVDCAKMFQLLCDGEIPLQMQNNNLQSACQSLTAYAQGYLHCARDLGYLPNMTGSGSAYYVWCNNQQDAENVAEQLKNRGFSCIVVHSVPYGIEQI